MNILKKLIKLKLKRFLEIDNLEMQLELLETDVSYITKKIGGD